MWINGDDAVFNGSNQLTAQPNTGSIGGAFTINGTPTKATLNGRNGLRSTAANDRIEQAFAWSASGVLSAFVVFDIDTIADSGTGSLFGNGAVAPTGSAVLLMDYDDPGGGNALVGDGYSPGPRAGVAPSPYDATPHFALFAAGTGANDQWVDGVQQTLTENASGTFPAYSSRTWTFLHGWDAPLGGDAYQILLLDYALSTQDRQKLEGWAAWTYGLEANLPSGHPYKSAAPAALTGEAGAAAGSSAAAGVGGSTAASAGASAGVAGIGAVGAATRGGAGAASGLAVADAAGRATAASASSAAGQGQGAGVGAAQVAAAGQAAGQAAANAVAGSSTGGGAGAAGGQAQATAVGAAFDAAAGAAAGSATAAAVGGSSASGGVGVAAAQAQASAVGRATLAAVGASAGVSAALAISPPPPSIAAERILAVTGERRVLAVAAERRVLAVEAERRRL